MDRQTLIHSLEWLDLIYGNWTCNGIGNIKKLIPIDFHEKILICRLNYNAHSHHQPITTYISPMWQAGTQLQRGITIRLKGRRSQRTDRQARQAIIVIFIGRYCWWWMVAAGQAWQLEIILSTLGVIPTILQNGEVDGGGGQVVREEEARINYWLLPWMVSVGGWQSLHSIDNIIPSGCHTQCAIDHGYHFIIISQFIFLLLGHYFTRGCVCECGDECKQMAGH